MRLRRRDLKPYVFKKWRKIMEPDGTTYNGWGDSGVVHANIQPAGGKLTVELYGERLAYMKVGYLEQLPELEFINGTAEGYGICIDAPGNADPDYKIVAVRPWGNHFVIDLEKVRT